MFALKTLTGRKTLDGRIYKEFSKGTVTVRELAPEDMADAYRTFGLTL